MKIAFLSFYQKSVYRGVETFVSELAERLAKNNDISVIQSCKEEKKKYKIVKINIPVRNHPDTSNSPLRKLFLDYWSLEILRFTIRSLPYLIMGKYDIIIPTNGGWQSFICRIFSILKKSKLIITGQCGPGYDERWNLLMHPDLFIALSKRDELWAKKYLKNVIKISNGVDLNKFNPNVIPAQLTLKKPIILCVSALTAQKRVDLVVKAVSRLQNVSLLVIGSGDEEQKNKIEQLGKNLLGNRFFLKVVPHNQIPSYYKACDVFTLASTSSESFGIVLVEAMASGLPVVATNDEVRKEIIGDAGMLVNPKNLDEYSEALKKTLETDWGNKPREQSEKFSWDKIAKDYETSFKMLFN